MATFHDGVLHKDTFGTPEMRAIFAEEAFIEHFLEAEAALARAEAEVGLVPKDAAATLTERASLDFIDLDEIEANVAEIDLFTMAIITAWKEQVGDAGEYIHWGATSQDISDMAFLLQVREGLDVIQRDLELVRDRLAVLIDDHTETPMIGRTHSVHAVPITLGLKFATWLDELNRHHDRLEELRERLFVIQFFGATGSLASVGEAGLAVQTHLADELDFHVPDSSWYVQRDRFMELGGVFSQIAATLGRLAQSLLILNRPEIGELKEPIPRGAVGSSTMPHKRNPVKSEESLGLARLIDGHANMLGELNRAFDERDFSTWLPEFAVIPELFLYLARLLDHTVTTLADLEIDEARLEANLHHHGSLVASEAVMMALASKLGRQTAHEIVHEHAIAAITEDEDFAARLRSDERVTAALSDEELDRVTDPTEYTGLADRFARRVADRVHD